VKEPAIGQLSCATDSLCIRTGTGV
jgi:hypothetical protein